MDSASRIASQQANGDRKLVRSTFASTVYRAPGGLGVDEPSDTLYVPVEAVGTIQMYLFLVDSSASQQA